MAQVVGRLNVRMVDTPRVIDPPSTLETKEFMGLIFTKAPDGSVEIKHKQSGSTISFGADGELDLSGARNSRLTAARYVFLGDSGTEEEFDTANLERIRSGDLEAVVDILVKKTLPHLIPEAIKAYQKT